MLEGILSDIFCVTSSDTHLNNESFLINCCYSSHSCQKKVFHLFIGGTQKPEVLSNGALQIKPKKKTLFF